LTDQQVINLNTDLFFYEQAAFADKKIDVLSIKTPLKTQDASTIGMFGISIYLDRHDFNEIRELFLHAVNKLGLKLNPGKLIQVVSHTLQIKDLNAQWHRDTRLFDYGSISFTLREAQCLHFLLKNCSAEQASKDLRISSKTVEFHIANIKKKLGCSKKSQVVNKAIDIGCIDLMFMEFE